MPITITFTTDTLTKDEAVGLFALLDTIRPDAFDPGPELSAETVQTIEARITTKVVNLPYTVTEEDVGVPLAFVGNDEGPELMLPHTGHSVLPDAPTVDANGLQWDERIHSGTKALNADGTWRTKRGVDKALVESVEAEMRGAASVTLSNPDDVFAIEGEVNVSAAVVVPPPPPASETSTAPLAPAVTESAPVETVPQTPSAPPAPSSAVSPFVALMKRVTTAQGAGKLTPVRVKELLESIDKKGIMDLRTDDDALASFAVLLDGEGV